jgi:YwqJ-like deaminase
LFYNFSLATEELFEKLGITWKSKLIPRLNSVLPTGEKLYEVYHKGITVLKGSKKEVEELAEKLKGMGEEAAEKYLDDLFEASLKLIEEAIGILKRMADEALNWVAKKRPTACSVLEGQGKRLFNYSFKQKLGPGIFPEDLHHLVKEWLEIMWKEYKNGLRELPQHHGKCAEVINISDWLKSIDITGKMSITEARKSFEGVVSQAKEISKIASDHNKYKRACGSCNLLLKIFNIKEIIL